MYWYRSIAKAAITLISGITLVTCLPACKPDIKETGAALNYFDIKGYFTSETARLKRLNPLIEKTVTHNGIVENKKALIADWEQELSLFKESDINRPAWKNSYTIITNNNLTIYRAKDPELKMHEMLIKMNKHNVMWILIFNKTPKNILYQTTEKLSYFPDSLYLIEKVQRVRLMGVNNYKIQGAIGK